MIELVKGDAIEEMEELSDNSIDLVLTDPPYGISRDTGFTAKGDKGVERLRVSMDFGKWDRPTVDELDVLMSGFSVEAYRVLKPGGTLVAFYDLWKLESFSNMLKGAGFKMLRMIEYLKINPVPLNSKRFYLTNAREVAIACVKGGNPTFNSQYDRGVYELPIHRDGGKRIHPTQKSIELMRRLVNVHSKVGDLVLDPFAGSGTTLVAAEELGRESYGIEKSAAYYTIAQRRVKKCQRQGTLRW